MNGRIFDPVLGRFLSADPNIDGVSDSQGYNRYSYVLNNPLNATDPSGYLTLREVIPAIVAVVVTVVVTVVTYGAGTEATASGFMAILGEAGAGGSLATTSVIVGAGAAGFASGFSGSLLNGGSIGDAFRAGLIGGATGAFTAWASLGIASAVKGIESGVLRELARATSHGTVGGLVSEAQGGEFRHGFYGSAASSAFGHSPVGERLMASNVAVSTATSMVIGGTASVLGGGKFANGAVTSAFQHLFNQVASTDPVDKLAKDAVADINKRYEADGFDKAKLKVPQDSAEFPELGVAIYKDSSGNLQRSDVLEGTHKSMKVEQFIKAVPAGGTLVATVHSHPGIISWDGYASTMDMANSNLLKVPFYIYQPATGFLRVYDTGGALHQSVWPFKDQNAANGWLKLQTTKDWMQKLEKTRNMYHRIVP